MKLPIAAGSERDQINNNPTTMTHLQPSYLSKYGKDDRGFIHLEGEFEYPADLTRAETWETLSDRAEQIGGLVTKDGDDLRVYPWNGPGSFVLRFSDDDEPVSQIDVLDRDGEIVEEYPIPELKEAGEMSDRVAKALADNMKPVDPESEPNWVDGEPEQVYRIDFESGELVPVDREGDDAEK